MYSKTMERRKYGKAGMPRLSKACRKTSLEGVVQHIACKTSQIIGHQRC